MSSNGDSLRAVSSLGLPQPAGSQPRCDHDTTRFVGHGGRRGHGDACNHDPMRDLELIDCGDGRRLERFGDVVVDRPAPAAIMPSAPSRRRLEARRASLVDGGLGPRRRPRPLDRSEPPASSSSAGRPPAGRSASSPSTPPPGTGWTGAMRRPPPSSTVRRRSCPCSGTPAGRRSPARAPGARVAHVDVVEAGRRRGRGTTRSCPGSPTGRSGGSSTTCARSLRRERRRGRRYDGVVVDPPTYGHGTGPVEDRDGPARRCSTTSPRCSDRRPGIRRC